MSPRPSASTPPARRRPRLRKAAGLSAAGLTAAALTLGLAQLPATGVPLAQVGDTPEEFRGIGEDPHDHGAENIDSRLEGGIVAPAGSQLSAARNLGVDVRWNDFGTPASLLPKDGSLGAASSSKPVAAARDWLRRNSAVLGLSTAEVADLDVVNNQPFVGSKAKAVLFRQRFGELVPAVGGMVTVGVANGQIAYVSSSLVKGTDATDLTAGSAALSEEQGWAAAAASIGEEFLGLSDAISASGLIDSLDVVGEANKDGWVRIEHPDFQQEQMARVRALAMADGTVKPVIEANVINVDGGHSSAYTVLVDASDAGSGDVLYRQNQVEQFSDVTQGVDSGVGMPVLEDNPSATTLEGELVADCNAATAHEFTITDNDTRQIVAAATALNPGNDIVVKIYKGDQVLTSGDTGTSPEAATYSADPIPQGTYAVRVCMFEGAAPLPPANYVGNVSLSSASTPSGGQAVPFPPKWRYFPTNPTPNFGVDHTPKNDVVGCWTTGGQKNCTEPNGPLNNLGARAPWDVNPNTELPTFTTTGNNVFEREAWFSPLTPGGFFQAPFSPERKYTNTFTDVWNNDRCDPTNLRPGGNDILFAVQNLFVSHNRMHDYSYFLGFNEKNYNLQQNNFGNGGVNGDPEIGNVQAGALTGGQPSFLGRDNANQVTLQDGVPGITNQYLFQPLAGAFYAPCTDGGLDMGIVGHEYTHAITNRMVGGPDEGLTSEHGRSMGESWADLVAGEYQFSRNYRNGGNIWAVGLYATGNKQVAIRDYAINRNPLTFGEFGFDTTGPEVHADGEIWNATMWRVRQALVNKHNARFPYADKKLQLRCSQGTPKVGPLMGHECPGNRRWVQLMFDSYLLQQGATSMLDARDAFIAADQMRYDGNNKSVIWKAFARSGMGKGARTPDADSSDVKPSFAAPSGNRTVSFAPTLPNGDKVPGKVYIGTYEARATPIADTLPKSELGSKAAMTPGTYKALFRSARTGLERFTFTVTGGGSTLVQPIRLRPNLAGIQNGAKVVDATEGSLNADFLIDGTEETNWGAATARNVDRSKPSVTVDLAGNGATTIRRVVVSAMLRPFEGGGSELPFLADAEPDEDSGSRFTALRKFAIEVCASSCDDEASWSRAYTSPGNAFPGKRPRPVAPDLTFRTFRIDPVKAQQVRLVTLENQCTGYKGYAGEQDNDPVNATDCKSASDRGTIVHAAELEVFER